MTEEGLKIYFAGKMDSWRSDFCNYENFIEHANILVSFGDEELVLDSKFMRLDDGLPIVKTKWPSIYFVGPYMFKFDFMQENRTNSAHGIEAWYTGPHGMRRTFHSYRFRDGEEPSWSQDPEFALAKLEYDRKVKLNKNERLGFDDIWRLNIDAIKRCDLFVAYLSDETCFGTLSEIGYAYGIGKSVFIFNDVNVSFDFSRFASEFAEESIIIEPRRSFDEVFENFLLSRGYITSREHVYVMRLGDTQHYKIGRTTRDPTEREKELNGTKAPYDVNLVCQIKTNDCAKLEAFFHEKYKETRGRGEWFNLTPHQIFELVAAAKISEKEAIDCSKLPLNLLGTLCLESN